MTLSRPQSLDQKLLCTELRLIRARSSTSPLAQLPNALSFDRPPVEEMIVMGLPVFFVSLLLPLSRISVDRDYRSAAQHSKAKQREEKQSSESEARTQTRREGKGKGHLHLQDLR